MKKKGFVNKNFIMFEIQNSKYCEVVNEVYNFVKSNIDYEYYNIVCFFSNIDNVSLVSDSIKVISSIEERLFYEKTARYIITDNDKNILEDYKRKYILLDDLFENYNNEQNISFGEYLVCRNIQKKTKLPLLINFFKKMKIKNDNLIISGIGFTKFIRIDDVKLEKLEILIGEKKYKLFFLLKKGLPFLKGYRINFYKFSIPINEVLEFDIQNKIVVLYEGTYRGRIIYSAFDLLKGKNRNSKILKVDCKSLYLRQTLKNTMYLTVRETNKYDYLCGRIKLFIAWLISKVYIKSKIILLYEKESSRYEESASVLYERLIDLGYSVYYIINKDNPKIPNIDQKYKKNFIYKDSLKHIIYFFKCKKFVGTETIGHAIQLRIANRHAVSKINSNEIEFVFLQHGVMYMVSLGSELRSGFRNNKYKTYRTVVSSKLEANHFIELGNFSPEDLYITGLAKFDKSVLNDDADKIVIMPTWRRWETNLAKIDFSKTKYYKMMERIVASIPKKLDDKIIVLPHPLMIDAMKRSDCKLKKYLPVNFTYDDILKDCKLLITDYSSISYDAFYRGCNVIFYWEEKEECMLEYGKGTTLMLTEELAFGNVCYNKSSLKDVVDENYYGKQKTKYKNNYRKIVEFHDNKNTDRIIECLKNDNIL